MRVGVFGATGQVGGVMRRLLAERNYPVDEIRYFASERSAGKRLPWGENEVVVEDIAKADFHGLDVALFSAGGGTSKTWAPKVAEAGATVVDNSSAWRMDQRVPLIVSEVNPEDAGRAEIGIIANPNCTTMAAMPVLKPLHDTAGLEALQITTFQAVSGSGIAGVRALAEQIGQIDDPQELAHDGSVFQPADLGPYVKPIAYTPCRWRGPSSTMARVRPTRRRSCATSRGRSSTSRGCWWPAPASGSPSSPGTP